MTNLSVFFRHPRHPLARQQIQQAKTQENHLFANPNHQFSKRNEAGPGQPGAPKSTVFSARTALSQASLAYPNPQFSVRKRARAKPAWRTQISNFQCWNVPKPGRNVPKPGQPGAPKSAVFSAGTGKGKGQQQKDTI